MTLVLIRSPIISESLASYLASFNTKCSQVQRIYYLWYNSLLISNAVEDARYAIDSISPVRRI